MIAVPAPSDEVSWLIDAPWGKASLIMVAAIMVLFMGNAMMRRRRRTAGGRMSKLDFDGSVARLESTPTLKISEAGAGDVHLEAVILSGTGALGSKDGHARVWHNRASSGRKTAVGAQLVIAGDETGQVGLENLEGARVIAPREVGGPHDTVSLYVGDLIEILGRFDPERHGEDPDPRHNVYGMMGANHQVQLRVLARYDARDADTPTRRA